MTLTSPDSGDKSLAAVTAAHSGRVPGRVQVSERALRNLAVAVTADAAEVSVKEVNTELLDVNGQLGLAVSVPLTVDSGEAVVEPVAVRAQRLQRHIIAQLRELADRQVANVDVRYTSVNVVRRRVK